MTFSPPTLTALGAYWRAQGGVNLGVVGDASHVTKGTSYHLGKSQLTLTAYSRQTSRDKAGLSEAASAIDLGKLDGTLTALRDFSDWLVAQCRQNAPGTRDMREVIWWDRARGAVMRWDRERGYNSAPRPNEADDSHKTHTHVSFYRDAEFRDHTTAFRPYFETEQGGTVDQFITYAKPKTATVPSGTWLYDNEACAASAGNIQVSPGRSMPVAGKLANGTHILGYIDTTPTETEVRTYFVKPGTVTITDAVAPAPPDTTPYSQADLDAARAAGEAAGRTAGAEDENERIALAAADTIRAL